MSTTADASAGAEDADVETSSNAYARRFSGALGEWFLECQTRATLELMRPWPKARVLDVGGGHAQLTGPLAEAGHDVTVYGSSEACGSRLRPWLERGLARFVCGDLRRGPWPERSFDVVLCYRLLAHARSWLELVSELCRLARAAVLVDYPSARSVNALADALFGLKQRVEGDTRPFRVFRDRELEAAFAGHGFRATGRQAQFFFPMALHRGLGRRRLSSPLEAAARAVGLTRRFGSPMILRLERAGVEGSGHD